MIRKLWFDEAPKQSGYYWLKTEEATEIVRVVRGRAFSIQGPTELKLVGVRVGDVVGKWSAPVPMPSLHRANQHESGLKELTLAVVDFLAALDGVMSEPSSPERGSKVAKLSNALNWANDRAMHFALGIDFDAMRALKTKRERLRIKARKAAG